LVAGGERLALRIAGAGHAACRGQIVRRPATMRQMISARKTIRRMIKIV
jgi:hypothetical protein